jgi:hypothetical protein
MQYMRRYFIHNTVRVEPLQRNDREVRKYTRAVSRQRLGKHVPAATDRNGVFCVVDADML